MKTIEEIKQMKNVPIKDVAEQLGKSQPFVRQAIINGTLPIGSAVKSVNDGIYSFHVSPGLLIEYLTGGIALKEYFKKNKEILSLILEQEKSTDISQYTTHN